LLLSNEMIDLRKYGQITYTGEINYARGNKPYKGAQVAAAFLNLVPVLGMPFGETATRIVNFASVLSLNIIAVSTVPMLQEPSSTSTLISADAKFMYYIGYLWMIKYVSLVVIRKLSSKDSRVRRWGNYSIWWLADFITQQVVNNPTKKGRLNNSLLHGAKNTIPTLELLEKLIYISIEEYFDIVSATHKNFTDQGIYKSVYECMSLKFVLPTLLLGGGIWTRQHYKMYEKLSEIFASEKCRSVYKIKKKLVNMEYVGEDNEYIGDWKAYEKEKRKSESS